MILSEKGLTKTLRLLDLDPLEKIYFMCVGTEKAAPFSPLNHFFHHVRMDKPGEFNFSNGHSYDGEYQDGKKHEKGTYTYSNNDK